MGFGDAVCEVSKRVSTVAGNPVDSDTDSTSSDFVDSGLGFPDFDSVDVRGRDMVAARVHSILAVREDGKSWGRWCLG